MDYQEACKEVKVNKLKYPRIKITEGTYRVLEGDYMGICRSCLDVACECEPDARNYKCESCNAKTVYGAQELMMMGAIDLVEDNEKENVRL